MKLNCANQAILSDGGVGNGIGYSIPLEIKPSGQFEPLYKTTLSVQVYTHFVLILNLLLCQLPTFSALDLSPH